MRIVNNYIESVTGVGIDVSNEGVVVRNNIIKGCGTWGITSNPNTRVYMVCEGNIITGCTSGGIQVTNTFTSQAISNMTIANNTIHGNSGPGIEFVSSSVQLTIFQLLKVVNNQLTSNTGYGIKFAASITDAILDVCQARIWNNNFYGNTLGATPFALTLSGKDNLAVNPGYTNSASNDFRIDGSTKAAGYMKTAIGSGIVAGDISYIDIGALQRVEPSASSGGSYVFGS